MRGKAASNGRNGSPAVGKESQSSAVAAPEWEIRVSKLMTMRRSKMGIRKLRERSSFQR